MSILGHIVPSPPRTPLQDTTNSMRSEASSPPFHTAKTTQSTKSRRRFAIPFFRHQNLDSSESIPSPHSSLWDASLAEQPLNTTIAIGNWNAASSELPPPPPAKAKSNKKGKRKERPQSTSPPAAIESSSSLRLNPNVHHPHLLDTITERSSHPTLRSYHPSIPSLRRDSPSASTLRARSLALRKGSFSLTDLPTPAPRALNSSSECSGSLQDKIIHPIIHEPQYDPPERMPTPPGLPRFNTPEAINYRLPSPHCSLREKLRRHPTPEQIEYRRQTSHLPPGVVMRGENGELIRGRWRKGGQSGHTGYGTQGALETHPFNRAPMADIASEGDGVVIRSEDTTHMGIGPAEAPRSVYRRGSRWERFVEMTCFVCCGVEMASDGQVVTAVPRRSGEEGRGQEAMMTGARPMGEARAERRTGFRRVGGDGWMY
ncbi:MAG: hypothetical protein LQ343_007605 [Gyalolechia ehrenbergii]|nr:MAG: hypothetical protein LQ343_007605 [Gyalolechia ehrenbergii]